MARVVRDETYFAPYDPVKIRLIELAASATVSIHIDIYGLTMVELIDVLIARHNAGLLVSVVADHSQAEGTAEKPQLQRLVDAGIPLVITTSSRGAIDHSKYLIVDGDLGPLHDSSCVGFGSFNFSASASLQDNTFSIRNDPGLVAIFMANWQQDHDFGVDRHPDWQLSPTVAASSRPLPSQPASLGAQA